MSAQGSYVIDVLNYARAGRQYTGSLTVRQLSRLHDRLADTTGTVTFALGFDMQAVQLASDKRLPCIQLRCQAQVSLVCQRSLQPFTYSLQHASLIAVVKNDVQAKQLQTDVEPYHCVDGDLDIADLIAEELLLALPLVAINPDSALAVEFDAEAGEEQQKTNPFAVLAEWQQTDN